MQTVADIRRKEGGSSQVIEAKSQEERGQLVANVREERGRRVS